MCVKLETSRLWLLVGVFSCTFAMPGIVLSSVSLDEEHELLGLFLMFLLPIMALQYIIQLYVYVVCRHVCRPPIGRFMKSAVEVVTVCAALTVRETMRNDVHHIISLVTITLDLHVYAQLSQVTPDIGLLDVLLGLFMQVIVYETSKEISATAAVMTLCGIVIIYRCWSYSPPVKPLNESKKLDGDVAC